MGRRKSAGYRAWVVDRAKELRIKFPELSLAGLAERLSIARTTLGKYLRENAGGKHTTSKSVLKRVDRQRGMDRGDEGK